jgi:hypothetical protein
MDKEFAEDSAGRKIAENRYAGFQNKKESDYGSIKLDFRR